MLQLNEKDKALVKKHPIKKRERKMLREIIAKQKGDKYMKKVSDMTKEELCQLIIDCDDTLRSLSKSKPNYNAAKYACDKLKFDANEALKKM